MTIWVLDSSVDLVDIKTLLGKKKKKPSQTERAWECQCNCFWRFFSMVMWKKIRGHEHRKERPKYFV